MAKLQPKTIMNRRIKELKEIFSAVDSDKMKVIEPSLIQAAKMELYIVDLARQLDDAGFVETYQNGENQTGKKESTDFISTCPTREIRIPSQFATPRAPTHEGGVWLNPNKPQYKPRVPHALRGYHFVPPLSSKLRLS